MKIENLRTKFKAYANKYENIRMRREDGILEITLHTDGGPLRWGRQPHAELEEAFLNIGRDRENKVVILTGTGDEFSGPVAEPKSNKAAHKMNACEWGELGWESKGLLTNLLAIDVPMISAVNGPAARHAERLPCLRFTGGPSSSRRTRRRFRIRRITSAVWFRGTACTWCSRW